MKIRTIIIPLLLTGCSISSDPTHQLNIYGEKKLAYSPELKAALQKSCEENACKRIFFEEKTIPKNSNAIAWVELNENQSFYMDFGKDGKVVLTYGKKALKDISDTSFFDSLKERGIRLEFDGYHQWNCYPPKDSCGRKEEHFPSPISLKESLKLIYQSKAIGD